MDVHQKIQQQLEVYKEMYYKTLYLFLKVCGVSFLAQVSESLVMLMVLLLLLLLSLLLLVLVLLLLLLLLLLSAHYNSVMMELDFVEP